MASGFGHRDPMQSQHERFRFLCPRCRKTHASGVRPAEIALELETFLRVSIRREHPLEPFPCRLFGYERWWWRRAWCLRWWWWCTCRGGLDRHGGRDLETSHRQRGRPGRLLLGGGFEPRRNRGRFPLGGDVGRSRGYYRRGGPGDPIADRLPVAHPHELARIDRPGYPPFQRPVVHVGELVGNVLEGDPADRPNGDIFPIYIYRVFVPVQCPLYG